MLDQNRKRLLIIFFIAIGAIFIARLFYVQVIDDQYKLAAGNNVVRRVTVYPSRGTIYDRNHKLLVYNRPSYDLMVVPNQVKKIDTTLFCRLFNISKTQFMLKLNKARHYSVYKESQFMKQISAEQYAGIEDQLYRFNGFYIQSRAIRKNPLEIGAHVLGYIGEVNPQDIKKESYYSMGDYIGKSGIELSYEKSLRGKKGVKRLLVDVHNRVQGSYSKGEYDTVAVAGKNLTSTIDAKLQAFGEQLMHNKRGSIVAIQPQTGEVLCMISSPTYDPNLLVGRDRTRNYLNLLRDINKPLFNRATMAKYPIGSTIKPIQALIGLQEGVLTPETKYSCHLGYSAGGIFIGCEAHPSPLNMEGAIQYSCNSYFCQVFRSEVDKFHDAEKGLDMWKHYISSFTFGKKTGIDLPNESAGFVPSSSYYDKIYGKRRWSSLTIVSLAIGQGEIGVTPLQLANAVAGIANRGYYITPHVVKYVGDQSIRNIDSNIRKHDIAVDKKYFKPVVDGMRRVVKYGTGRYAQIDSITLCGKTGTVENPHGKDHSFFIAFAPKDNPQIAIEVTVENATWGSAWAAPIASLMVEKYLRDSISRPKRYVDRILNGNFLLDKNKDENSK